MGISSKINLNQFYIINTMADATSVAIIGGFNRYSNIDFTPGGKYLIISGRADFPERPDRSLENEIFMADADGNNIKLLPGAMGNNYTNATLSYTGKWMAFVYGPTSFVSGPTLTHTHLNGNEKDIVNIVIDRSINCMKWSSDGRNLYFLGA